MSRQNFNKKNGENLKNTNRIFLMAVLAFFMLAILPYSASAASSSSSELSITFLNQDPDPVEPGQFVKARFKVENIGLAEARNVEIEISPEYPFSLYQDSNIKKISSISPRQKGSEAVYVDFTLRADVNAVPGDHEIKIRYKSDGSDYVEVPPFDLEIKEADVVVTLNSFSSTPEVVRPGERAKLVLDFENMANTPVRYLTVKLGLVSVLTTTSSISVTELPFSPVSSTNELVFTVVQPKEKVKAEFNFVADPDALSKVYKIPVTYTYVDKSNTEYEKESYISVLVGHEPELTVSLDNSQIYKAGQTGEVIVKFVNRGLNDIKFLYATLEPNENADLLSSASVYVGNIDSDDYETVTYKLHVKDDNEGTIQLPLHIEYKDVNNNDYKQDLNLDLKLYTTKEAKKLGFESNGNGLVYVIVALLAIGGFVYYKRRNRKK